MTRWRYSWSVPKLDWAAYTSSTEENGPTNNVISSAAVWGRSWDLGPGNIFMTSPCTCSSLQHLPSHAASSVLTLASPLHILSCLRLNYHFWARSCQFQHQTWKVEPSTQPQPAASFPGHLQRSLSTLLCLSSTFIRFFVFTCLIFLQSILFTNHPATR